MSLILLSLRLYGDLPPTDDLTKLLGAIPTTAIRKGEQVSKRRIQPVDIWILDLVDIEDDDTESVNKQMVQAGVLLQTMASTLASLDRTTYKIDLYLGTVRREQLGGFALPIELVVAAASGKLDIEVSITVVLNESEDDEES